MTATVVWREGRRIRGKDGSGYGDMVPDAEIWKHIAASVVKQDLTHIEFAVAVLRHREIDRAAGVSGDE